jgi:hypothetical protein
MIHLQLFSCCLRKVSLAFFSFRFQPCQTIATNIQTPGSIIPHSASHQSKNRGQYTTSLLL